MTADLVLELFGGPGGFSEGARMAGVRRLLGLELDAAACATRRAAGHRTVRANVAAFPVAQLVGRVTGLVGSPPCTTFSAAGDRAGASEMSMTLLAALIGDLLAGRDTRAQRRETMAARLDAAGWPYTEVWRPKRLEKIAAATASAVLVAEPARFIAACRPEWVALEQVDGVLPLWEDYAFGLRAMGYSAWCGILNAADYGVGQARRRAILIASRTRRVARPEPTHYDPRKGHQLWGTPHVTMAGVLGWGATGRPAPTVTAGGTSTGGAEPFGHRSRDLLAAEQAAGRWILHTNRDQQPDGSRQLCDPGAGPAPALTARSGGQWRLERGHGDGRSCTLAELAALQSFPAGYPFQGGKTACSRQIGNAVPPLLAAHIVAMATGLALERAA